MRNLLEEIVNQIEEEEEEKAMDMEEEEEEEEAAAGVEVEAEAEVATRKEQEAKDKMIQMQETRRRDRTSSITSRAPSTGANPKAKVERGVNPVVRRTKRTSSHSVNSRVEVVEEAQRKAEVVEEGKERNSSISNSKTRTIRARSRSWRIKLETLVLKIPKEQPHQLGEQAAAAAAAAAALRTRRRNLNRPIMFPRARQAKELEIKVQRLKPRKGAESSQRQTRSSRNRRIQTKTPRRMSLALPKKIRYV